MNHDTKSKKAASNSRLNASPKLESVKPATATPDEIHHMIAVAAYCRAESRGFTGGHEVEDWLAAEAKIEKFLANRLPGF